MPTFLFDKIVFGPVKSRRLGVSLGVNLLPLTRKFCNFDCIYCECGFNGNDSGRSNALPSHEEVYKALDTKLAEMLRDNIIPDVITFAGNGEPTLHPQFPAIIDDTIKLRNKYFSSSLVAVLSNSTMLHKPAVVDALKKVDQNILKLDAGLPSTIQILNQPVGSYSLGQTIEQFKQFKGKLIIQTMFLKGKINNVAVDNTTEHEIALWEKALTEIKPQLVMIYTIDRETPHQGLQKIPNDTLQAIAGRVKKLGIQVLAAEQ